MVDIILNAIGGRILLYISIGLLATSVILGTTVKIQSSSLTASKATIKQLQAEKASLGDKISEQNRKVAEWVAKAKDQEEKARTAQAKAERVRTITVDRVREVTVATIPQSCPDAVKWSVDHAIEFNKRWEAGE